MSTTEKLVRTPADVAELVTRLSYKRGWAFSVKPSLIPLVLCEVVITLVAESSIRGNYADQVTINFNVAIYPEMTPEDVFDQVLIQVRRIEAHETHEWFQIDGKVYAPGGVTDLHKLFGIIR